MGATAGQDDNNETRTLPMLVYVSREKKTLIHPHYKAGALNVLAPYTYPRQIPSSNYYGN